MKRKATLFLAAIMAASSFPMTAYAANFKDINDVPWNGAQTVINQVADLGLLGGYEDNTFRAKNNVTYCEAMQMVYKVMTKSGAVEPINAVDAYPYMSVLNTYKVPSWAQMAVAYGLHNNIIDMQMVVTNFAGGSKQASREDVALLFGNAMSIFYDKEKDVSDAKKFSDYFSISTYRVVQVDLLKRLGIVSGDDYNRFNPKKNINRAEMAVMLNKTYDVLTQGVSSSGEITEVMVNEGKYYYIEVALDGGGKENFQAVDGQFPVYVGNGTETISLKKISEGDKIVLVRGGNDIIAIRQMKATTEQKKYEITGYIYRASNASVSVENENSGDVVEYKMDKDSVCYVDDKKVHYGDLEELMKEHYKEHAYVGLTTRIEREKVDGKFEDVTYVDTMYVEFQTEYSMAGEVKTFTDKNIVVKQQDSGTQKTLTFHDDCEFYIADSKVDFEDVEELADAGTFYVKVSINQDDEVVKLIASEDRFQDAVAKDSGLTYKVESLSDKKMTATSSGKDVTFVFGSTNPAENITFYKWAPDDKEWDKLKNVDKAAEEVEEWLDHEETVYCKVVYNKGDRISEIYLSDTKNAWKYSEDFQTERKGTVASLEDDILKFKTSTTEYKLLKKYESGDLNIDGTVKDSKIVLTRLANDSDVDLYAEIVANGDNEAIKIDALVKSAEGKLVEFEREGSRFIKLETADGNEFTFDTTKNPSTDDEEEYDAEDLASGKYYGSKVKLEFSTSGNVDKITLVDSSYAKEETTMKGRATLTADGLLKIGSSREAYYWQAADKTYYRNYSMESESLTKLKALLADSDVEVYAEVEVVEKASGKKYVEYIDVYVKAAEGELANYEEGSVRIKTDDGNTFTFIAIAEKKLDIEVDDMDAEDLERGHGDGANVKLVFSEEGDVVAIEEA